jgi:hypothetical protein
LYDLFQTEVRNAGEEALGQRVVCIEHVLSADAIEPVLARMLNHGGNECIHVHGSWLLGAFPRHNRSEAHISLLISKNCAQALCAALERYPGSKEVQGAALSTIFPIQQTCQFIRNLEGVYFINLV